MNRIKTPEQLDATIQQLQSDDLAERRDAGTQLSYVDRHHTVGFELAMPVILDKAVNDSDVYVRERCIEAIRMAHGIIEVNSNILDIVKQLALDKKEDDPNGWVRDRAQELLLEVVIRDSNTINVGIALKALLTAAEHKALTANMKEGLVERIVSDKVSTHVRELSGKILTKLFEFNEGLEEGLVTRLENAQKRSKGDVLNCINRVLERHAAFRARIETGEGKRLQPPAREPAARAATARVG